MLMFDLTDDTIVAISSAPGRASRGIVRLSGPAAISIGGDIFRAADSGDVSARPGFTRTPGQLVLEHGLTAPAECYLFRAPHSYTRQDCLEIHTVGAPPLLAMIIEQILTRGARLAEPGEFTARAFYAGAIDLLRVEAVAATLRAQSDAQLRAARAMSTGHLTTVICGLSDQLAELTSLVEADIDFAEEPIEFITPAALHRKLLELSDQLDRMMNQAVSTERLDVLPKILLTGAPNVGKSSLLNSLTGLDRAICSVVAGTTRDVLSAPLTLEHGEAILLDTAGHQGEPGPLAALTRAAIAAAADTAELICLVVDASCRPDDSELTTGDLPGSPHLIVANKADLIDQTEAEHRCDCWAGRAGVPAVPVSARTGAGLEVLRRTLDDLLTGDRPGFVDHAVALTARQRDGLTRCREAVHRAAELADRAASTLDAADLLALELREALDALSTLTGTITTDDLLARVFAEFCIGK